MKQYGKCDAEPRRAKLGALLRPKMARVNPCWNNGTLGRFCEAQPLWNLLWPVLKMKQSVLRRGHGDVVLDFGYSHLGA